MTMYNNWYTDLTGKLRNKDYSHITMLSLSHYGFILAIVMYSNLNKFYIQHF